MAVLKKVAIWISNSISYMRAPIQLFTLISRPLALDIKIRPRPTNFLKPDTYIFLLYDRSLTSNTKLHRDLSCAKWTNQIRFAILFATKPQTCCTKQDGIAVSSSVRGFGYDLCKEILRYRNEIWSPSFGILMNACVLVGVSGGLEGWSLVGLNLMVLPIMLSCLLTCAILINLIFDEVRSITHR